MKPEEETRDDIDDKLDKAGWTLQHRSGLNLDASIGLAIREFPQLHKIWAGKISTA
jgi:hypothetical protein